MARFDGSNGVGSVNRLVGIDSRRKRAQVVSPGEDGDEENRGREHQIKIPVPQERPVVKKIQQSALRGSLFSDIFFSFRHSVL